MEKFGHARLLTDRVSVAFTQCFQPWLIVPSALILSPGCIPAGQLQMYFESLIMIVSLLPFIGGV